MNCDSTEECGQGGYREDSGEIRHGWSLTGGDKKEDGKKNLSPYTIYHTPICSTRATDINRLHAHAFIGVLNYVIEQSVNSRMMTLAVSSVLVRMLRSLRIFSYCCFVCFNFNSKTSTFFLLSVNPNSMSFIVFFKASIYSLTTQVTRS